MLRRRAALIFGAVAVILATGFVVLKPNEQKGQETIFPEEQQIEAWLQENDLNQYGDPKDTVYLGGTPLFDETTSQSIDRYEYILRGHSDRPWKK